MRLRILRRLCKLFLTQNFYIYTCRCKRDVHTQSLEYNLNKISPLASFYLRNCFVIYGTAFNALFEKKSRSHMWKYFRQHLDRADCLLCNNSFTYNGGTTSNWSRIWKESTRPASIPRKRKALKQTLRDSYLSETSRKFNHVEVSLVRSILNVKSHVSYQGGLGLIWGPFPSFVTEISRNCSTSWSQTTRYRPPRTWAHWSGRHLKMGRLPCQYDCTMLVQWPWLLTSGHQRPQVFATTTAHFLDGNWNLVSCVLEIIHLPGSHTGIRISEHQGFTNEL